MSRRLISWFVVTMLVLGMVAGCGGGAAEPEEPPATPAEMLKMEEVAPTSTPEPVEETEEPEEPEETEEPEAEFEEFTINGVTMPFSRREVIISDRGDYSIFDSFNPFIPNGEHYENGITQVAKEFLWVMNYGTGELEARLGESWEYNDDYTELTIRIREGVMWSDGEPFTAHDVAFTMNMALDPAYDDLGSLPQGDAENWNSVTATDDYTVVFDMKEPSPRQHQLFWAKIIAGQIIVPEHIWSEVDAHTFKNNPPVYTGPYTLMETYPENKVFVWERNDDYWGKSIGLEPKPKYAIFRTGPTGEQWLAEIKENKQDTFTWPWDQYEANKDAVPQINQVAIGAPCPRAMQFNTAKGPHLTQPEFRRALSMMMNRQKWGDNIWTPPSKPAQAPWADYRQLDKFINEEAREELGTLTYDPESALELLESIGYVQEGGELLGPDGEQVSLSITTRIEVGGREYLIGQDFTEELKAIGIDATFEYVPRDVHNDNVAMGDFEIVSGWMCGATIDALELYENYTCADAVPIGERAVRGNPMRYCNEEFDALVEELKKVAPEDPSADELYQQAFAIWMRDVPIAPGIESYRTTDFNTTYWDNMPSQDNIYTWPMNWWNALMLIFFEVEPKSRIQLASI